MRKCILAFLLCIPVTLTACKSAAEREREQRAQVQAKSSAAPDGSVHLTAEQINTNHIQITAAVEEDIAPAIAATGRIKPRAGAESQVFAPFAGKILVAGAQTPRLGAEVRAGQLLAEIEQIFTASERVQFKAASLQLQTDIEQARQDVDLRQKEFDRARQLYEGGAIALKEFQTAESNLKQAQAKLEGALRSKVEYDQTAAQQGEQRRTPIRVPISGTIVATSLIAGEQVDPSKSLATIVDTSTVWAEVAVREGDLAQIRHAVTADIINPTDPARTYNGRLVNIGIAVDPQNRTVPMTFAVPNSDRTFKIEMAIEARIPAGSPQKMTVVPAAAILSEQGISSVFVESQPGIFQRRVVTGGQPKGGNVAIVSGLAPGEKVVSVGAQSLNSEALKSLIPADEEGGKR
jgi:cobalt-zinc-cadmium efflux system membrane fusion protein